MIDIHSHILWGLDDGSESLEQSLAMLREAAAAGTTDIVATPHANSEYKFNPGLIQERIAELQAAAGAVPRIHTGCDFHLSFDNIEDAFANPTRYTIDHLNYLLVEFPDFHVAAALDDVLRRFVDSGITPIVTHPERNAVLQQSLPRLESWVKAGCLVQVTSLSLLGLFGRPAEKSGWEMINQGLVHILASDCHDPERRHPRLDGAWQIVRDRRSEAEANHLLIANPGAVIAGKSLPDPPEGGEAAPRKKKWFSFWL